MSKERTRLAARWLPVVLAALSVCAFAVSRSSAEEDWGDCTVCHENLVRVFETTTHARIRGFETPDGRTGCATCHGDAAGHIDSGGDPGQIVRLGEETDADRVSEICLDCHGSDTLHDWRGSAHPLNGVSCADCHDVHAAPGSIATDPDLCLDCHREVEAQLQYPSHHPVREGHMNCGSCHAPHGSSIGMLIVDERPSDLCFSCHTYLEGPFLFEHEPLSEGCDGCHEPHGAVANNLLQQNEPFLCLQCHEMHFHAGLEADDTPTVDVPLFDPNYGAGAGEIPRPADAIDYPGGVPNPWLEAGYKRAFTTKCTQCHTHVHGTDLPSQSVPSVGRGLMR